MSGPVGPSDVGLDHEWLVGAPYDGTPLPVAAGDQDGDGVPRVDDCDDTDADRAADCADEDTGATRLDHPRCSRPGAFQTISHSLNVLNPWTGSRPAAMPRART